MRYIIYFLLILLHPSFFFFFFFNDTATTEIYTLSLHDALPISTWQWKPEYLIAIEFFAVYAAILFLLDLQIEASNGERSEEHTSELQSHSDLVCRLLLEKKKKRRYSRIYTN